MEKLTREQVIERLKKGDKNFSHLDLRELDLSELNFSHCDFSHCDFSHCDFYGTNLSNANLSYAKLSCAKLSYVKLSCAYLEYANLLGSNLFCVDLSNADLFCVDLSNANLFNANLKNANLYGANLENTKLNDKEQIRKGLILKKSMIGYKKCIGGVIVTLEIPKGAIVLSINNDKCRTNKAKVLDISNGEKIAYSVYDNSFAYELGKKIEIEDFDLAYNIECSTGIHFFRTREEAEKY